MTDIEWENRREKMGEFLSMHHTQDVPFSCMVHSDSLPPRVGYITLRTVTKVRILARI